jgi:Ca2+-binding EF-hand superfamily protein
VPGPRSARGRHLPAVAASPADGRTCGAQDTDGDGKFSKDEFRDMCWDLGHFFDGKELDVAFNLVDADGSGFAERAEMLNFWRTEDRFDHLKLGEAQMAKLQELSGYFKFFDKDKNGRLDREEMGKMMQHMEKSGYLLKQMNFSIEGLDKNHDGMVHFNEFVAYMIDLGALDGETRPAHG